MSTINNMKVLLHFGRMVASLIISQLLLFGLLSTKKAANSTPLLVALPILTLFFHKYYKHRFEPAFRKYSLEDIKIGEKVPEVPIESATVQFVPSIHMLLEIGT